MTGPSHPQTWTHKLMQSWPLCKHFLLALTKCKRCYYHRSQGRLQTTEVTRGKFISFLSRETQQGYNQRLMCAPVIGPIAGVAHNWTSSLCPEEHGEVPSLQSVTLLVGVPRFSITLWKILLKVRARTAPWGWGLSEPWELQPWEKDLLPTSGSVTFPRDPFPRLSGV